MLLTQQRPSTCSSISDINARCAKGAASSWPKALPVSAATSCKIIWKKHVVSMIVRVACCRHNCFVSAVAPTDFAPISTAVFKNTQSVLHTCVFYSMVVVGSPISPKWHKIIEEKFKLRVSLTEQLPAKWLPWSGTYCQCTGRGACSPRCGTYSTSRWHLCAPTRIAQGRGSCLPCPS